MLPNLKMVCNLLVLLLVVSPLVAHGDESGTGSFGATAGGRARRAVTDLTPEQHQAYVARHNELRGGVSPAASNMEHMVYDALLAATAQEWSQKCDFRHSRDHPSKTLTQTQQYGDNYGENLAVTSSVEQPDVNAILQAWYDEVQFFGYDDLSCASGEQCGHYTQAVWAQSNVVGCGVHHCPDGVTDSDTPTYVFSGVAAWMITCHYAPAGNYQGVKPYISGPSCTKCDSGLGYCINNNCASVSVCADEGGCACRAQCVNCGTLNQAECRCECLSGWSGADCSIECRDTISDCTTVAMFPSVNCPAFNDQCPVACSVCSPPADDACDPTESTTPSGSNNGGGGTQGGANTDGPAPTAASSTPEPCTLQCANGGSLNSAVCNCTCASGYQGTTCQFRTAQVLYSVVFRVRHDIALFSTVRSALLGSVADALNAYCASSDNYRQCCPDVTDPATNSTELPDFIEESNVLVASGYPTPETSSIYRVGVVALDVQSPLCVALSVGQRKRRSTHQEGSEQRRFRRQSDNYLDQNLLSYAIAGYLTNIRQQLLAVDSTADILSAGPGDTGPTTSPVTTATPTSSNVIIIVAVVAGVAVLLIIFCIFGFACLAGSRQMAGPKYDDPPSYPYEEREPARRRPATLAPEYFDNDPMYHPAGHRYDYVSPAREPVFNDQEYAYAYADAYPEATYERRLGSPQSNLYALDELSPAGRDYYIY
ncbi:uncharacterized protein LOC119737752 isoform X2 [Patiria miniata]|uniref:EGF-like domain-containing protein n=1 Tax=Patiria miniata TaxID=46514 RepID=A0A914AVW5_PATMI|nr:uncharacterized protein LOC119737752 isoform X2 [Patiria miniata]